jgi:NAD(P)-dependent dehydrogenase (short-subunit alcohol dehydrogenase family)
VSVAGRRFIVTGGTGALGSAVVRALVEQGARVAVPYRSATSFDALRLVIQVSGALFGSQAELADASAVVRFVEDAARWLGGLDGVAAAAGGYAGSGPLETAPAMEWADMMQTNLASVYAICRAALPLLLREGGSVVTVGSGAVESGGAGAAAYAVSKAGVHALTRALALENRERNVRFNCIVPGTIDTPANRKDMPGANTARWTPPEQIARVIVFLLSPESAPVTGAIVPVQGRA